MRIVLRDALVQLPALSISEWQSASVSRNAVPDFLYEGEALLERQPVDTKRFY